MHGVIVICVTEDAHLAWVGIDIHTVTPMTALLTSHSRESEWYWQLEFYTILPPLQYFGWLNFSSPTRLKNVITSHISYYPTASFAFYFLRVLGFFFLVCILRFYFGTSFLMLPCMYIIRFSEVYSIISVSMPLHHINTTCLQNLTLGLTSCLLDSVILYYFFYQCI